MTAIVIVGLVAFGTSLLTLFSGFGLGTLLLPAFALFLPVEAAVASTAIVHAANNLFKAALLARGSRRDVILRFGIPAVAASFAGAALLAALAVQHTLVSWSFLGREATVTPVKLVMGGLILLFAAFELIPALHSMHPPVRWLPLGGALSGFFGGLSGHQGALRAAFLAPLELSPAQFVGTQAVIALMVDAARLLVYGGTFLALGGDREIPWTVVVTATLCAFIGALVGKRLLPKMTVAVVRRIVGALLVVVGVALVSGVA
jgi:hypothetical protein